MEENLLIAVVDMLIKSKLHDQIEETLEKYKESVYLSNVLATVYYLLPLYRMEKQNNQNTIFDKVENVDELINRYTRLKFYIRRIEFDLLKNKDEFKNYLLQENISALELVFVMQQCAVNFEIVEKKIRG